MKFLTIIVFLLFNSASLLAKEVPNVIIFKTMTSNSIEQRTRALISYMSQEGFVNNKSMNLHIINADLNRTLGQKLFKKTITKYPPSLVISDATIASQIAKKELEGSNVPLLFYGVTDPVGNGIVKKIEVVHKDLVTGSIPIISSDKVFNIILRVLSTGPAKKPYKIGLIYSSYPSSYGEFKKLQKISKNTDIKFVPIEVESIDTLKKSLQTTKEKYDYLWLTPGPFSITDAFVEYLIDIAQVPLIYIRNMDYVKKGVLIALDADAIAYGKEVAQMAVSILNGKSVTDIKVRRSNKFELGINMKTANKMKLVIPSDILNLSKKNLFR